MSNRKASNQTFTQSRRNFLKGAAYTSVLSMGGLSSLALAADGAATLNKSAQVSSCAISSINGISVIQQKMLDRETVTLINQSDKIIMVNALQPINLEQVNGSLVVKVNQIESEAFNGMIAISPSERISFDIVDADILPSKNLDGIHLQITSEHSVFNRIVPVQLV